MLKTLSPSLLLRIVQPTAIEPQEREDPYPTNLTLPIEDLFQKIEKNRNLRRLPTQDKT